MALTELQIKQAKPGEKRYMIRDDRGLYLEVMPSGSKYWRLRYWENGKERKLDLGRHPGVSLREARNKRDEVNLAREKGFSPRAEKKNIVTFEAVALEWHEKQITPKTPKHAQKVLSILKRLILPAIGSRDIGELTAPELLTPLRAIEARKLNETAHTALQICGQIFRYAIASGYTERNPASDLRGALAPVVVTHNASLTSPREIAALLLAMRGYAEEMGSVVVHHALWFSAYTFLRPVEVRCLEWREVDLDTREIRIPAEKMKMRRLHVVPLSNQVVELLEKLRAITGRGKYVFPSIRGDDRPMSNATVISALRRMGYTQEQMSAHGFRSMASTRLYEHGWPSDAIERQLAHVEGNAVKAAYNYAEYLPQRRELMQWWADWLDGLKQ